MRKNILKLLIGSLCVSALVGIMIIMSGSFGELEIKVLVTTLLIFCYSIPGLCSSTIYEKGNLRLFSILGMGLALITCIYMLCLIWNIVEFNLFDTFKWKIIGTLNLLCWSSGHISLILLINNKHNIVSTLKNLTILFSAIMDYMILISLWSILDLSDFYYRLMWVFGILITLGTIGTPILNTIYGKNSTPKNNTSNIEE